MKNIVPGLAALLLLCGCSGIKRLPPKTRMAIASATDTLYLQPVHAEYLVKGFVWNRTDSARVRQIEMNAEDILRDELQRAFPAAVIKASEGAGGDGALDSNRTVVSCSVKGYRRTVPRQVVSEAINVVELITSFGLSMAFPITTTSTVYLEIRNGALAKPIYLKHRDEVNAYDREDLRFQVRKMLEPRWRG